MSLKEVRLGDICLVKRGTTITQKQAIEGDIPVVAGGLKPTYYHNQPNRIGTTITVSGSGANAGFVNLWRQPIFASDCSTVEVKNSELDIQYIYYFLLSKQEYIYKKLRSGAAQPHVYGKDIADLLINIPTFSSQQKIVAKLDAIFAEIDKATVVIQANATNADALFHSFLSNIEAPLSALGEYVTIKTGKLDSNASVENGIYPFFTCSKEIFFINDYAFDCEAVLLAGNNASGDFNVKHYKGKFNAYQRTYVITIHATDKLTYRYLYYQLINALKVFKNMSVGANTKFLKIGMIKELKFPLPPMDEQIKILNTLEILERNTSLIKNNYQTRLNLTQTLKKSILHQAFSGELIKEYE